ncbi:MAG TPA: hypothetical protein VGT99_14025 [Gammaproteobacteria bacterium]|nr:hypothetical protein [Gammaproteobacteria bacterium]
MSKKTARFNKDGISKLPNDKPVLYTIETEGGKVNYAGVAKKGRVQERLEEHLRNGPDPIPGVKVRITQKPSIQAAESAEKRFIKKNQPKHNKQHK